ncbi:hypothetical protein GN958_ATG08227 [Phytophthora infestans]|uniref:Uncharacterized protein n=1 Tax=Phytophthora infestans TaxID=4787 RepID=A0A8S9USI7_PHYIN|nr:hypothetical protein GN958_ATG08227 [Phytophthora infestans]
MGHPSCQERDEFTDLHEDAGNNRTYHICNHCNNAYRASRQPAEGSHRATPHEPPVPEPKRIRGRPENYRSHLKFYQAYIQTRNSVEAASRSSSSTAFQRNSSSSVHDDASSTRSEKRQKRIDQFFSGPSHDAEGEIFMRLLVEFQADNRLPDSFIERLSTVRFCIT